MKVVGIRRNYAHYEGFFITSLKQEVSEINVSSHTITITI
jgi:hypothetical protein